MTEEPTTQPESLLDKLKQHIRLEEDMDPSMLSFYLDAADRYVQKKLGHSSEYLQIMVATAMNDNRSSSDDLATAMEALEPIFYLEVLTDDNATDQPTAVGSQATGT